MVGDIIADSRATSPGIRKQLSRQCHDRRLAQAATVTPDAFFKPLCEHQMRLVSHPKPGELDQRCSKSRIAGFRTTLFAIDRSALPGRRCKARVSRDLSSVIEMSAEPFRPENSGARVRCP